MRVKGNVLALVTFRPPIVAVLVAVRAPGGTPSIKKIKLGDVYCTSDPSNAPLRCGCLAIPLISCRVVEALIRIRM